MPDDLPAFLRENPDAMAYIFWDDDACQWDVTVEVAGFVFFGIGRTEDEACQSVVEELNEFRS